MLSKDWQIRALARSTFWSPPESERLAGLVSTKRFQTLTRSCAVAGLLDVADGPGVRRRGRVENVNQHSPRRG